MRDSNALFKKTPKIVGDRYHMSRAAGPAVSHTTLRMVGIVVFPVNRSHQRYATQFGHKRTKDIRSKLVGMDQGHVLLAYHSAALDNPAKIPLTLHWDDKSGKTQGFTSVLQPAQSEQSNNGREPLPIETGRNTAHKPAFPKLAHFGHLLEAEFRVDARITTVFREMVVATRASIMIDHIQ